MEQQNLTCRKLVVNPKLYPLSAIYGAAYVFIDKVYIHLDGDPNKKIEIYFKPKENLSPKDLEAVAGDFENELLNYALREQIVKSNQKIREHLITQALLSPLYSFSELASKARDENYLEDPLGIAQTWEEHFGPAKRGFGRDKLSLAKKLRKETKRKND